MTDSNYTHIKLVVDRSGSMGQPTQRSGKVPHFTTNSPIRSWDLNMSTVAIEMTEAINSLFAEQAKLEGKCLVDYSQFDGEYETVFTDTPVYAAKAVLEPRGMTALNDAIGKGIVEFGAKLAKLPEAKRPGKVLFAIVTDGNENASREYDVLAVNDLITEQTNKYGWDFVFLGANMDAIATAGQYGISKGSSISFDTANTGETVSALNNYATSYRSAGSASFSDKERRAAKS